MSGSSRKPLLVLLSLLFAIAPFIFGTIRAVTTGRDYRMLWMAAVALPGAIAVRMFAGAGGRDSSSVMTFAVVTLVVTTVLGAITAYVLGATSAPGVWGVAGGFGLFWAASYVLHARSRRVD
jgi:hypothetical protein